MIATPSLVISRRTVTSYFKASNVDNSRIGSFGSDTSIEFSINCVSSSCHGEAVGANWSCEAGNCQRLGRLPVCSIVLSGRRSGMLWRANVWGLNADTVSLTLITSRLHLHVNKASAVARF